MTLLENKSGSKGVRISKLGNNDYGFRYHCTYFQIYVDDQKHEQVIEIKDYKTEKRALKWANSVLA